MDSGLYQKYSRQICPTWVVCGVVEVCFMVGMVVGAIYDIEWIGVISGLAMFFWLIPFAIIVQLSERNTTKI